jgi:C4-dicarboxylate-specific signal transduction histidine kinase
LIVVFFLYFGITSRQEIVRGASHELTSTSAQFSDLLQQKIALSRSELNGLASSIELAMQNNVPGIENRIRALLLEEPGKFESIYLYREHDSFCMRPRKNQKNYDVEHTRIENKTWLVATIHSDSMLITGPSDGRFGPTMTFFFHRTKPPYSVQAVVNLNFFFQQIRQQMTMPARLSLFVVDENSIILDSRTAINLKKNVATLRPIVSFPHPGIHKPAASTLVLQQSIDMPKVTLLLTSNLHSDILSWRQRFLRISIISIFFILIGLTLAWSIARRFAKSIGDVTTVATKVAQGDFSQKLQDQRNDELGILFHAFNQMTTKLQRSYDALRASNIQLEEKITELTETRKELSQKQRLAVVGEAISKISHEIQNKIGGVSIWVQNLERYLATDPDATEYIDELKLAMQSFMEMLVHFKRFYREPVLNRQATDLVEIVDAALSAVHSELINKNITIQRKFFNSIVLHIDGEQIKDVLVNILLNAIYYTPANDSIEIELASHKTSATLSIQDSGAGIAKDSMETIFQPFQTTKSGGSGLGLAISQNIIKAHGGKLTAHNAENGGAVFVIELEK